jgi:site-specific recombinase XerD
VKKRSQPTTLTDIFAAQIEVLATTLRPETVYRYRWAARSFLVHLQARFPHLHQPAQLHRDPHVLSWLRFLSQHHPPLRNSSRAQALIKVRRLLRDLTDSGHPLAPDLLRREDLPPPDHYLPRPLPPEEDHGLQLQLRRTDTFEAGALRLIRATGIRVGECMDLPLDCLQSVNEQQAALHVPLGKLHSERWVPVDEETQHLVARLVELRALGSASRSAGSQGFLLPRRGGRRALYHQLRQALSDAATCAGCTGKVTPHRLRHSYATEMVRLGVSLPALMQILGHKDIRMTLRYAEVTQQDLQREFYQARRNATQPHRPPTLPIPKDTISVDLPGIHQALAATRHLMEMYRRSLPDEKARRKLQCLARRLRAVADQLGRVTHDEK